MHGQRLSAALNEPNQNGLPVERPFALKPHAVFSVVTIRVEEHPVLLVTNDRITVAPGIRGLRYKCETSLRTSRPINGRTGLHVVAAERLHLVYDLPGRNDSAPLDVERDCGRYRSDGWNIQPKPREALPTSEVVEQVVSVHHGHIADTQRSDALVEIGLYGIVRGWDNPEKPVGRDSWTVVVDLLGDIGRSNRTGVDVQSDEHERPVVVFAILADIFALHGAHVGSKRKRAGHPGFMPWEGDAHPSASAPDHRIEDQTIEVPDL
jgi:hypothetical protein